MMNPIRAVLFDFGGVLAEEGFSAALEALAGEQRLPVGNMTAEGLQAAYDSGFVLGRGTESDFWALMRRRTGLAGDDATLTARVLAGFVLRPWMLEVVQRLRDTGCLTAILSDQSDWLERLEARQHFFRLFDRVYNSYRLGKGKRDPSLFTDVAADLQVPPTAMLFVDDNPAHLRRAAALGLRTIHYTGRVTFMTALEAELALASRQ